MAASEAMSIPLCAPRQGPRAPGRESENNSSRPPFKSGFQRCSGAPLTDEALPTLAIAWGGGSVNQTGRRKEGEM